MASTKERQSELFAVVSPCEELTCRQMMREYLLYYDGKLVGGLYDDRLLVKSVPAAEALLPGAPRAFPYENAREMILVERTDDGAFLRRLFRAIADDLPAPKPKTRAKGEPKK